jgi:hypothetical protein
MAHHDEWDCAQDDFLFPIYEKCMHIAEKMNSGGVKWEVKFSSEKARLASTLSLTASVDAPNMTKSFSESGNFQTTLNSEYYDLRSQMNESIQREDAEKGRPPPQDPEVLIAKFAEDNRKNWAAYTEMLSGMKVKLKDRPLLMDVPYGKMGGIYECKACQGELLCKSDSGYKGHQHTMKKDAKGNGCQLV